VFRERVEPAARRFGVGGFERFEDARMQSPSIERENIVVDDLARQGVTESQPRRIARVVHDNRGVARALQHGQEVFDRAPEHRGERGRLETETEHGGKREHAPLRILERFQPQHDRPANRNRKPWIRPPAARQRVFEQLFCIKRVSFGARDDRVERGTVDRRPVADRRGDERA
jgi:hypothetical protein